MQKIRVPFTNFAFGEVSESTIFRTDTPIYQASAQRIENMALLSEGGLKKRPGAKYIDEFTFTRDTTKRLPHRLEPFIFSGDERYIVMISNARLDIYIIDPDTDEVSLATTLTQDTNSSALPFDDDYMHEYTFAQYGDVMFICHPLFMPRQLIRTGLTSFEVTPMSFDQRFDGGMVYQPYTAFHASDVTLEAAATTGSGIVVDVSVDYFDTSGASVASTARPGYDAYIQSDHIGVTLIYGESEMVIVEVNGPRTALVDIVSTLEKRLAILNPLRTTDTSSIVEVTHLAHGLAVGETIVIKDATAVGGINANQINGTRTIAEIIDENTYTFTAGAAANESVDGGGYVTIESCGPTTNWAEQSFSALRGYPAAVAFHENRLCFGGTIAEPDVIWMSKTGGFYNFYVGEAADDDAINIVAATTDVHEIRFLNSNRDLQVFTSSSELYIPTYLNQAITPTNAQIRRQTPFGCTFVQPKSLDGASLFVQNGGKVVREYLYTDTEDAYSATAVSSIAAHLVDDPIQMAVVHAAFNSSESFAMFVRQNGELALFSSNRAERRAGWVRYTSPGDFQSVCAIHGRVFALLWHETRSTETLVLTELCSTCGFDFSGLYSTTPVSVSGVGGVSANVSAVFDDGVTVSAVGVGETQDYYIGEFVVGAVTTGSIFMPGVGYSQVKVGIPFTVNVTSNPIDANITNGPQTGEPRGVSTVVADIRNTQSMSINNRALVTTAPYNGKKELRLLGYGRDPQVVFTQNEPLPFQLNGFIAELIV